MVRCWQLGCLIVIWALINNAPAEGQMLKFLVHLSGDQEVPMGSGDPDGTGRALLWIDSGALTIDWNIKLKNVQLPISAAHIHQGAMGTNGPVVVDFHDHLSGSGLHDPDLAAIIADPTNFYVNVHNAQFPGGAVRGQLSFAVPEPGAAIALGLLSGLVACRRRRRE